MVFRTRTERFGTQDAGVAEASGCSRQGSRSLPRVELSCGGGDGDNEDAAAAAAAEEEEAAAAEAVG